MASPTLHSESEDRQLLEALIKGMGIPPGVLSFDIEFHDDSTGDPSIFLLVKIDEKFIEARRKRFNELWTFTDDVQRQALKLGISRWPYVRLVAGPSRRR